MPAKVQPSSTPDTSKASSNAAKASGTDAMVANAIEQHKLKEGALAPDDRHTRIAVAAYRLAESRGFAPGGELEDWLRAEREAGDDSVANTRE
jgi:hypothetical protein